MTERVEEIRRQHVSAGPYMVHEPTRDCDVCALLTALAQAERERDEEREDAEQALTERDEARAEVERLTEDRDRWHKAWEERRAYAQTLVADLARVRAALRLLADAADGEGCAGSTIQVAVDKARAALEGRSNPTQEP